MARKNYAVIFVTLVVLGIAIPILRWRHSQDPARGERSPSPVVVAAEDTDPEVQRSIDASLSQLPAAEDVRNLGKVQRPKGEGARFESTPGCSSRPVLLSLLRAPTLEALPCLWDAIDLNPHRVSVSAADRSRCEQFVRPYFKSIDTLRETANHAASKEFLRRVGDGDPSLPHLSRAAYIELLRKKAPGWVERASENGVFDNSKVPFAPALAFTFDVNLFRESGGTLYAARVVDMPSARPAYEAMAFANLELVRAIVAFGVAFEVLSPEEAADLLASMFNKFNEMIQ